MKLTVGPLKQKDAGQGLANIDPNSREAFDIETGDYVLIKGNDGQITARIRSSYPEDEGKEVIRIDSQARQELGVNIGDQVHVEMATVQPADSITLAFPENLTIHGNISPYIRNQLAGQALRENQKTGISVSTKDDNSEKLIPVKVVTTSPEGSVIVTDSTSIDQSENSLEYFELSFPNRIRRWISSHFPPSSKIVSDPLIGSVIFLLLLIMFLILSSLLLEEWTGTPFLRWLQVIGTIMIVMFSALTLYYRITK